MLLLLLSLLDADGPGSVLNFVAHAIRHAVLDIRHMDYMLVRGIGWSRLHCLYSVCPFCAASH